MADWRFVIDVFDSGTCGWRCRRKDCGEYGGPYGSPGSAESGASWHQRRHEHTPGLGLAKLAEVWAGQGRQVPEGTADVEARVDELIRASCTCPDINITAPGDRGEQFVKGVDWGCPACVDITADAAGNQVRLFKPHIDGRARFQMYSTQLEQP